MSGLEGSWDQSFIQTLTTTEERWENSSNSSYLKSQMTQIMCNRGLITTLRKKILLKSMNNEDLYAAQLVLVLDKTENQKVVHLLSN